MLELMGNKISTAEPVTCLAKNQNSGSSKSDCDGFSARDHIDLTAAVSLQLFVCHCR